MASIKVTFLDGVYEGSSYEGKVLNGKFHGHGVLCNKEGHKFEGMWNNGIRHGAGKYTYENSESYEGEYQNGIRNGFGVYTYKNGDEEHGQWVDGNPYGEHEYIKGVPDKDKDNMTAPLCLTRNWTQSNSLRKFFRTN